MYVVSDYLTTGQVTFIFRVVIQILSYGSIFLLGLILLGHTPLAAPLETHDTINRMVGKSTATLSSLRWIKNRILSRTPHPTSSLPLIVVLVLSLAYGVFVPLTDVGFIGLHSCSIPYPSYTDFPASIRSEADAFALVNQTVVRGMDPNQVKSFRCSSSELVQLDDGDKLYSCTSWTNSTYGSPSSHSVNLTDTDVLMYQLIGPDGSAKSKMKDLQAYYFGSLGSLQMYPKVKSGIAVLPHSTGATMVIGAPNLNSNQTVDIPKTMALEISFGCLPLGLIGTDDELYSGSFEYFLSDEAYKPNLQSKYTGPHVLYEPLVAAADSIRQLVLPSYNSSSPDSDGFYFRNGTYSIEYTWTKEVSSWKPAYVISGGADSLNSILDSCTTNVYRTLDIPFIGNDTYSRACATVALTGSVIYNSSLIRGYDSFVCAPTTSLRMVSTTLNLDQGGILSTQIITHPSVLHETKADFWDIYPNSSSGGLTFVGYDGIQRYTLSEGLSGSDEHYILQKSSFSYGFTSGAGSVGHSFPKIAMASLGLSSSGATATERLINSTFFYGSNHSSGLVTEWAGRRAASFMLSSYALNGWAALGKEPLTIRSTSGRPAVCYDGPYFIAFIPLLISTLIIIIWTVYLLALSKLGMATTWERRYGGMEPTIVASTSTNLKKSRDDVYVWENIEKRPHLRLVKSETELTLPKDLETSMLVNEDDKYF